MTMIKAVTKKAGLAPGLSGITRSDQMRRELGGGVLAGTTALRMCDTTVAATVGSLAKPHKASATIMAWAARLGRAEGRCQALSRVHSSTSSRSFTTVSLIAASAEPGRRGGGGGGGGERGRGGPEIRAIGGLAKPHRLSSTSMSWAAVLVAATRGMVRAAGGQSVRPNHTISRCVATASILGDVEGQAEGGEDAEMCGDRCREVVEKAGEGPTNAVGIESRVTRKKGRRRLDELCVERCPQYSRTVIQSWILQGKVLVDGRPAMKAGMQVTDSANIEIIAEVPKYVCRAGLKLEAALLELGIDVQGKVVLDAGLSTGGFADCLLQNGVARIYGVDVGYGQVAEKIRTDSRVVVMERTNLRYLEELPELVDLVTLDLSFISIMKVMPAVCRLMKPCSELVALIKPQFEARRDQVGGGGIVRSSKVHEEVLSRVVSGIAAYGFDSVGRITSPIKGAEGNVEFLAYFKRMTPLESNPHLADQNSVHLT